MHIVAIHGLAGDKEKLAPALAAAMGVTAFEARSRLRSPGEGPFVVGVFGETDRALALAGQLEAAGFGAVVVSEAELEAGAREFAVRRFALGEQDLEAESQGGGNLTVPYRRVELILRGIGISSSTSTETTKQQKFDLGAAVLSGGLKMTKTTKTTREVRSEAREGFVLLYAGEAPPLVFRENSLVYDALGPLRGLSHSENFVKLIAELRRLCPAARYDDRLLNRAGLAAVLGPKLDPETYAAVAAALIARVLRKKN
jgi:hypothetical protein